MRTLPILFLAAAISIASAKPAPKPAPAPTPAASPAQETPITQDDIIATMEHQQKIFHDITVRTDATDAANKDLNQHLTESNSTLNRTLERADGLQQKIESLAELRRTETARANTAEEKLAKSEAEKKVIEGKYHSLKFQVALLAAVLFGGIAMLLILRFGGLALNSVPGAAIAFGVPAAIGIAVFTFVQFKY